MCFLISGHTSKVSFKAVLALSRRNVRLNQPSPDTESRVFLNEGHVNVLEKNALDERIQLTEIFSLQV